MRGTPSTLQYGFLIASMLLFTSRNHAGAQQRCVIDTDPKTLVRIAGNGPQYEFVAIDEVVLTNSNQTLIVDRGGKQIRLFDSQGAFVRSIGRPGEGPGEFGYPRNVIQLAGDTIALVDSRNQKFMLFELDGTHLSDIAHGQSAGIRPIPSAQFTLRSTLLALLGKSGNSWTVLAGPMLYPRNPPIGSHRDTAVVITFEPGTLKSQRIAATFTNEVSVVRENGTNSPMYIGPLMSRETFAARLKSGEFVIADAAQHFVTIVNSVTRASKQLPLPFPARLASRAVVDAEVAASTTLIENKAATEAYHRATVVSDHTPSVSGLIAGSNNWFWVEKWKAATDKQRTWYEMSSTGARGCEISLRINERLKAVSSDRIAVSVRDADDVERVEVRRITRGR